MRGNLRMRWSTRHGNLTMRWTTPDIHKDAETTGEHLVRRLMPACATDAA
jgi:hypothetical protein